MTPHDQSAPAAPPTQSDADKPTKVLPTKTDKLPEPGKFPCEKCGARLEFSPTDTTLKCPYCGAQTVIAQSAAEVVEKDLDIAFESEESALGTLGSRQFEVRCQTCGAELLVEANVETDKCPYCAGNIVNRPVEAKKLIPPESVLPFKVDTRQARLAFQNWLSTRWFAPSDFAQQALAGEIAGLYVPYWTFDSMTINYYDGMRGDNYWVTESYNVTDANGQTRTETRQVMRTNWYPVSGRVDHWFDDVLVPATKSLPEKHLDGLQPWDLADLKPFTDSYLAGFRTERYQVGLKEGFQKAEQIMAGAIRSLCTQAIGGDQQILSNVSSQYLGRTYKHTLLPVWHFPYRYREKLFRIVINARTGQVNGDRPISWGKVAMFTIAIITFVAGIAFLFSSR